MMIDSKEIQKLMIDKELNKVKLAEKLGIADMTLIRKLRGKNKWLFDEVWQLTQILDCEMNDLLKKEEK